MVFHSDCDGDYTPSECKEIVKTFDILEPYFEQEKAEAVLADEVDEVNMEEENRIEIEIAIEEKKDSLSVRLHSTDPAVETETTRKKRKRNQNESLSSFSPSSNSDGDDTEEKPKEKKRIEMKKNGWADHFRTNLVPVLQTAIDNNRLLRFS